MKKVALIILSVLLGLFLLFVVCNRFDARPTAGMFTANDLAAANFDYDNGYYRIWTLGLDDAVDVEAIQVKDKYRRLFDPQFDNDKEIRDFNGKQYRQETDSKKRLGKVILAELHMIGQIGDTPPISLQKMLRNKNEFVRFRERQQVLLQRYQGLLASDFFQDFTAPNFYSPIPNLLTWLHLAKVQVGLSLVDASAGKWMEATDALIKQMDFGKRAVAGSRLLINNLVAKAILSLSAQGLSFLMNQKECPASVYSRVLAGMPPLRLEEYGSRNAFISEFLFTRSVLDDFNAEMKNEFGLVGMARFFAPFGLQKNRTLNEKYEYSRIFLEAEASPLQIDPQQVLSPRQYRQGFFWWWWNPTGKMFLEVATANLGTVVFKSLRIKSLYDMTRISAELHLRYDPQKSVHENLGLLTTYQAKDPCSGKPYIWNDKKQILYSIGIDQVDNGGSVDTTTVFTDVALPCILYVQAKSAL